LVICPVAVWAQLVSFGIKGGVPVTNAFDTARTGNVGYLSDTKRYLVGGAFELRFPLGLGVEFDALYKRLNYESTGTGQSVVTKGNSWEFPVLFKLRGSSPGLRPYLTAGPSFRHLSGVRAFLSDPVGVQLETTRPAELENRFSPGFAVGGGLELGNRFRFAPEIRYTRWGSPSFRSVLVPEFSSSSNQLDFLLGIHF
jgi:opacity protein-like surface antigen